MESIKYFHDRKTLLIFGLILLVSLFIAVIFGWFTTKGGYVAVPPTAEHVPHELIVNYKEGQSPHELRDNRRQKLEERLESLGVISQEKVFESNEADLGGYYLLHLGENVDLITLQEALSTIKEIKASQPNFVYRANTTPNDPMYPQLWGMQKIGAPTAWDTTTGSNSVVVAVLDSGINSSHPDLSSTIISPYNAFDGGTNVSDQLGHGTHVSGTIGAVGNNGIGVAGVNWNVKIMPVKVLGASGSGSDSTVWSGIEYAINNGADIINMSLGGNAPCASTGYNALIQKAISNGITVVVAAGNDNSDASNSSPASCSGVISVGAVDQADKRSIWIRGIKESNWGSVVDIAAPGTDILSTVPGGGYKQNGGTSMASPHVAGAAALLLSVNPGLSPAQVEGCLVNNADPISTDRPIGPRLNIAKALENCAGTPGTQPPTATPVIVATATPTPASSRFYISGRVFQDNNGDGTFNSGDLGLSSETLNLSGSFTDTTTTLTDGTFIFDNLFEGTFNVSYSGSARNGISLTQILPAVIVNFIVTKNPLNPTPTIIAGQPNPPPATPTPTPVAGATRAPTPTPPALYTCEYDPTCSTGQKNIQLCPLICTPK